MPMFDYQQQGGKSRDSLPSNSRDSMMVCVYDKKMLWRANLY